MLFLYMQRVPFCPITPTEEWRNEPSQPAAQSVVLYEPLLEVYAAEKRFDVVP